MSKDVSSDQINMSAHAPAPAHRLLIDCAFLSRKTPMTGIPRVAYKYLEWGYRYGAARGMTVLPVYVNADGVFDARYNLPEWTHAAPLCDADVETIGRHVPEVQRRRSESLYRRHAQLRTVAGPVVSLLTLPLALSNGALLSKLKQRYVVYLNSRAMKIASTGQVQVRPGDILFMPAYWHDEAPASYFQARQDGAMIAPMLHDVLPITIPEDYNEGWRDQFFDYVLGTLQICDHVLYISAGTRDETHGILERERIKIPKHSIRHHGSDLFLPDIDMTKVPAPATTRPAAKRDRIKERQKDKDKIRPEGEIDPDLTAHFASSPFNIVMIGSIEPKKNHVLALRELQRLWNDGVDVNLTIIGRPGWKSDTLVEAVQRTESSPIYGKHLFWTSTATDTDLAYAYKNSQLCLLASSAEGFGLPLIEALISGLPVLASDIPPFREIGGDSIAYFDPGSPGQLAAKIEALLNDREEMQRLAECAKNFQWKSWEQACNETFDELLALNAQRNPSAQSTGV